MVQQAGLPTGTAMTAPGVSDVEEMPCRAIRAMDVTYWREMLNSVSPDWTVWLVKMTQLGCG